MGDEHAHRDDRAFANDNTFEVLKSISGLQALTALMADYPATVFEGIAPKFDCQEQARDGTCPYLIVVTEKGESKAWTASEFDDPSTFTDYPEQVNKLLPLIRKMETFK